MNFYRFGKLDLVMNRIDENRLSWFLTLKVLINFLGLFENKGI